MRKKFRLIKTYPGSPDLNTIVVETNINNGAKDSYFSENWGKTMELQFKIGKQHDCENNPEYWEEVIEKDYEILSLARFCSIKPTITDVSDYGDEFIESLLKCDKARVHSVKRKDGEIFTIGDKVVGYNNSIAKIKTIDLVGEVSLNIGTDKHEGFSLKNLKKAKQPLFTTEDGVDIFEGESYYELITPDFHNKPCIWNILPTKTRGNINYNQEGNRRNGRIWFSTKENAEEYIIMNKPCLSINDITYGLNKDYVNNEMMEELIEKAKQKL